MNTRPKYLRVSTPGRICLFGEHQDYLSLPVIPCAISLRITLEGRERSDRIAVVDLPDINSRETFPLGDTLPYTRERDYLKSAANVLLRQGFSFSRGVDCTVHGDIPINSGTSSSSALVVAWINFLARMSDQSTDLGADAVARLAHEAEVLEFGEPGGMMDHFSTAYGGVIVIDFDPLVQVHRLEAKLGTFVLGDSREPKDTRRILARVKQGVQSLVVRLKSRHPEFTLKNSTAEDIEHLAGDYSRDEKALLLGTIHNHSLTEEARRMLGQIEIDHRELGELLTEHQSVLRDVLRISTPRIDRMISAAISAGALGGKINGSGGGGCMFAYAPEDSDRVRRAIEAAGGRAYVITPAAGTSAGTEEAGS
jgi:galactokinase